MKITPEHLKAASKALEQFPQINGAAFGFKEVDGKPTDAVVLKLSVEHKVGLESLKPHEVLPKTFMGYAVDVVERQPRLPEVCKCKPQVESVGDQTNDLKDQWSYLAPGQSVGDTKRTGSVACILKNTFGDLFALSNYHVFPVVGEPAHQPGPADFLYKGGQPNRFGKVHANTVNSLDAAIIKIDAGYPWRNVPPGQTYSIKAAVEPEIGMICQKVGRTTGFTQGRIESIGFIRLAYDTGWQNIYSCEIRAVEPGNPDDIEISEGGDSGSLWTLADGSALALHFAGEGMSQTKPDQERAYGCPMHVILDMWRLSIATQSDDSNDKLNGINSASRSALVAVEAAIDNLTNTRTHLEAIRNLSTQQ